MRKITVRKYTTDGEQAFNATAQYMAKGKQFINKLISESLDTVEKARALFQMLFSEIISDLYITKFWINYNALIEKKKKELIAVIADWYCEMGNIMGYCGIVLEAFKEV